jgi:hypothetical protein
LRGGRVETFGVGVVEGLLIVGLKKVKMEGLDVLVMGQRGREFTDGVIG